MKKPGILILAVGVALAILLVLLASPVMAGTPETDIVSVGSDGTQGNLDSQEANISGDGLWVAFSSYATNLVSGDTNGVIDVFIRDLVNGTTTAVSVSDGEVLGNNWSSGPSIDADGSRVAFTSEASNLVNGADYAGVVDIFVRDLASGTTTLVSVSDGEAPGNDYSGEASISADGSCVAFSSWATNLGGGGPAQDIFLRDLANGTTTLVSVSDGEAAQNAWSQSPSVDADGSCVAFASQASNLVNGEDNAGVIDVFVRDLPNGTTTLVSVSSLGEPGNNTSHTPSIDADGSCVTFESFATNLVSGDTNGQVDVFVHDLLTGITRVVSVSSEGTQGNGWSYSPSIDADGSCVAFMSFATNLVPGDTNGTSDVFVHDLLTGITRLVSVSSAGTQGDGKSNMPSISADGSCVAFASCATNLVPGDTNGKYDVFVSAPVPVPASRQATGPHHYEQTDPLIVYSGQWDTGSDDSHSGRSNFYSDDPEGTITITFKGTRLDWIAAVGSLMDKALVSLDGGEPVLVDLFSQTELFQQMVWSTGTLEYGVHVIKITFPANGGEVKSINIDALDVWGTIMETTES
jgi:Tol biopolymer transport system component